MQKTIQDGQTEVWMDEKGNRIVITECECTAWKYFYVFAKAANKKGKTVKTRCTYDTAISIVKQYEKEWA